MCSCFLLSKRSPIAVKESKQCKVEKVFVCSFTSGYLCVPSRSVYWKQFSCAVLPVGIFVYLLSLLETVFACSFTSGYLCVPSQSVFWKQFLCTVLPVGIFVYLLSQSSENSFCAQSYQWVSLCTFSVSLLETVFVHSLTSGYLCVPSQSVF